MTVPVIAIDGTTASGKGTVAAAVARRLGFHYLDSGAIYRLVALRVLRAGVDLADEAAVAALAGDLPATFEDGRILLAGEDVTDAVRGEACGNAASKIAVLPRLRANLLALQRGFRRPPGLVADGRDMGTVVFPAAKLKVYLTASLEERADRRYKQLISKGNAANITNLLRAIEARDRRDSERAHAPLMIAADAVVLDTTGLDIEASVKAVLQHWPGFSG